MRAGLMTGRYQQRFGYEFNPGPPHRASPDFGLPLSETTIPQVLARAGYVTGMVGKWHLGLEPGFHPTRRGFQEFFGFPHGSHTYFDKGTDKVNPIMRGREPVHENEYLTDAFTREAVAFIERHKSKPFFLYLSYNAVHGPLQAPQKYLDRFKSIEDKRRRTYAAMLGAMDDGIGQVMSRLKSLGLERDTLIFFLSDNGGPPHANASSNTPLRATKGRVYEGGIRVPFVVRWNGRVREGSVYDEPVISLDLFATAVAAAGAELPGDLQLDGVNLLPYVGLRARTRGRPHEKLYWRIGSQHAIRRGPWKLVRQGGKPWELYDLANDIGEKHDLAIERRDLVSALSNEFAEWNDELADPLWKPVRRAKKRRAGGQVESER
jgi:arylsulfatase A-like enzyme